MSKGNPVVHTRITPELKKRLDRQLASLAVFGNRSGDLVWDYAAFVRQAIAEKLDKMERSRRPRPGRRGRRRSVTSDQQDSAEAGTVLTL